MIFTLLLEKSFFWFRRSFDFNHTPDPTGWGSSNRLHREGDWQLASTNEHLTWWCQPSTTWCCCNASGGQWGQATDETGGVTGASRSDPTLWLTGPSVDSSESTPPLHSFRVWKVSVFPSSQRGCQIICSVQGARCLVWCSTPEALGSIPNVHSLSCRRPWAGCSNPYLLLNDTWSNWVALDEGLCSMTQRSIVCRIQTTWVCFDWRDAKQSLFGGGHNRARCCSLLSDWDWTCQSEC